MVALTEIQIVDLFFRFAAVGQLILLIALYSLYLKRAVNASSIGLAVCVAGYALLTAPIVDHHYGFLRNILLLVTDLTPAAILWFTSCLLNPKFRCSDVPKWLLAVISCWLLVLAYVFLVLAGRSVLHDANHALGIMLSIYVVYLCIAEFLDDLDNKRRNVRILVVAFYAFYMAGLVVFEFVWLDVKNTWQFSLFNAMVVFGAVSVACYQAIASIVQHAAPSAANLIDETVKDKNDYCSPTNGTLETLKGLMEQGVYLQPNLTVKTLAEKLTLPEHQLRQLINQQLGFSNFSHYLNSYRIPWVCQQLQDLNKKSIPILTLALEAGYGSIAPFNRAFKAQMKQTPTQYRDRFQK